MIVLVCGSRNWARRDIIFDVLDKLKPNAIIHGGAKGADRYAEEWAAWAGVTQDVYLPDYSQYGRVAPHKRNDQMLDRKPDRVLAFWDGKSPGTKSMIAKSRNRGITVSVYYESERKSDSTD